MQKKPLFKTSRQFLFPIRLTKKLTPKQSMTLKHLILWKMTKSKQKHQQMDSAVLKRLRLWQRYNPAPKVASTHIRRVQKNEEKESDFFTRFLTRQTISHVYGTVRKKQLTPIVKRAMRMKGHTGQNLISLLESRLDIVLYRIGFSSSIHSARQLINHGKVLVNGSVTYNSGSCLMPGDILSLQPATHELVKKQLHENEEIKQNKAIHVEVNYNILSAIFLYAPTHVFLPTSIQRDDLMRSFQ